mgnify:CR=1 FL=1
MTVSTQDSRFAYSGDGVTVAFSFPRKVISASDITVYLVDETTDTSTLQTNPANYTFMGSGLSNGIYATATITFVTAPTSDQQVVIFRDGDLVQEVDFESETDVQAALNRFADRDEMKLQRLSDQIARSLRMDDGDPEATMPALPHKALLASKILGFDTDGNPEPVENNGSSNAVTAAGSTTARTLAARFGDMLSPEDFGAVGDGSTDDKTPLTNWLNAVMASSSRCGYMPAKTYAISGALPNITVSGVTIVGAGPSSSHDVGSAGGTILKAITNSGFTMMTVAPTEGASAQRLDSVRIIGVSFNCNSLAAKGLLVKSVFRGEFDVYAQEATTSGFELDVATTLGEAKDCQRNIIRFIGRQYSNTAPGLRLKGSSVANISFNQFEYVDVGHYNGTGIICENADNNVWHDLRVLKAAGGSATDSIEWRGGATDGERVRGEYIYQLSTTVRAVAKGTGTYTVGAGPVYIDALDTENSSPLPIAEAGASIFLGGGVKGTDAPSASTTDLARYGADFTDITGTTGISALGTVRAGGVRRVRFTGILTLTHNATSLILPGAANITTAANDTATFVSLGSGNWLCLSFQKASGQPLAVVSVASGGTGGATAQAAQQNLKGWYVLAASGVQGSSHTGTTAETVLNGGTITIPAGAIGPNGAVCVRASVSVVGTAAAKNLRVRLGGLSGDLMHSQQLANTTLSQGIIPVFFNRNSASSQVGAPTSTTGVGAGSGTLTGTQNTANALDLVVTAELINSADAIRLENIMVEVFYQA